MPRFQWPSTLFGKTAITVGAAFVSMQLLVLGVAFVTILYPLAQRSADDLAALIVLSAQTWVELPPETRRDFKNELSANHDIWIMDDGGPVSLGERTLPYLKMMEEALERRLGKPTRVRIAETGEPWFWADLSIGDSHIRIGFPQRRIGAQPVLAFALVFGIGTLISLITSLLLVRRITRPLSQLTDAVTRVGSGRVPDALPETGSMEQATLARTFNRMALQVRELLDNRTTLLAGVSHDLRTPLARLRLALEMVSENPSTALLSRMRRDIDLMNGLLGEFLDLARGLQYEETQQVDVTELVRNAVEDARNTHASIEYVFAEPCLDECAPRALRRILDNIIQNAIRYGEGGAVTVHCEREGGKTTIRVLDEGQGIAEDQLEAVFRPFYRIESSRSISTGGSGLGLAIARQLAEAYGWRLELRRRECRGMEARITL